MRRFWCDRCAEEIGPNDDAKRVAWSNAKTRWKANVGIEADLCAECWILTINEIVAGINLRRRALAANEKTA